MSTVANAPLVIDNIRPGGTAPAAPAAKKAGGDDEMSFWDFVDIINPLQHLPIISTIYREITGDTIKPITRVAGGALFGGVVGAAVAVATEVVEEAAGLTEGETLLSLFKGDGAEGAEGATDVAQAPATATATDRIAAYAGTGDNGAAPAASNAMPASAVSIAAAPAAAETPTAAVAAATTTTAGSDARFFPAAQAATAGGKFMPLRAADFRPSGATVHMPAPEKRPAGLASSAVYERAVRSQAPASAGLLTEAPEKAADQAPARGDGARFLTVPSKAQMAARASDDAATPAVARQTADAAVLRALQAQGLEGEAAHHPMLRAAAAPVEAPVAAPVTGAAGYATAAESLAAAEAAQGAAAGVQEVPGWFDQAMMSALNRYQQTGRLNTAPTATTAAGA